MNIATVKLVVDEMWDGPDSQELSKVYEKIARRLTEYSTEGLIRQFLEFKRQKKYLLHLSRKDEFERRLVSRELSIRNIQEIDLNEVT